MPDLQTILSSEERSSTTSELCVDLAGVPHLFRAAGEEVEAFLPASFAAFRSSRPPRWRVDIERATVEAGAAARSVPSVCAALGGFRVDGMGVSARVDLGGRGAELTIPPSPHALAVVLRHLLPVAVEDGLVFHAALLAGEGRSWLCCGSSGAGKSTLARLLASHACCDEMAAVRRRGDGWQAEALPFWQSRPSRTTLEAVYLLRHGERHRRRRLEGRQALRQLSPHLLWPTGSPPALDRALDLLCDLVGRVPVCELEFLPRPDVLDVIVRSHGEAAA